MKKCFIFVVLMSCFTLFSCEKKESRVEENKPILKFDEQGKFKIAQFTDIHWDNVSENCIKTIESIKYVLNAQKPDIAILTGDIVTEAPAVESWLRLAQVFEAAQMPWTITLGNHDAEIDVESRSQIFSIIDTLTYFVGENGPKDIEGAGNYVLPVMDSKLKQVKALLYGIDTNNQPKDPKYGHYDWVHFNQIEWYRKQSKSYTHSQGNKSLPALAFLHIPLSEYGNIVDNQTTVGINREGVAGSDINSGLFASFVEMGDVMGVFCGHDHNNDYIGIEKEIALAFGRRSGADAYGDLPIGARIIQLYEGQRKFDTWICTQEEGNHTYYYYPSGLSSVDEEQLPIMKSLDVAPSDNGVSYSYYEGEFREVSELAKSDVIEKGVLKNFSLSPAKVKDWMGFEYSAWIKIPETGVYRFYTFSDDGSVLYIDNKIVVDNDGSHSERRRDGKIALEKGFHKLQLLYFERYMGEKLEVGYASRNIEETLLPDSILFVK